MEQIIKEILESGYDFGIAYATEEEIKNGAACGQLAIIEWFCCRVELFLRGNFITREGEIWLEIVTTN